MTRLFVANKIYLYDSGPLCGHLDLYDYVMQDVEKTLIEMTLSICKYNQSRAARNLGVSRGKLRSKLRQYFGDKYFFKGKEGE